MFYFFPKNLKENKENNLFTLIIKLQILFSLAIISSTVRASSVHKKIKKN